MQATLKQFLSKWWPALLITGVVLGFIINFITHGSVQHPGKTTYANQCAICHGENGEGIKVLVPPLMDADFARNNIDSMPCWIKNGMSHAIVVNGQPYDQNMYGLELDEVQIANVINYLSEEMLHTKRQVSSQWVKQQLKGCK